LKEEQKTERNSATKKASAWGAEMRPQNRNKKITKSKVLTRIITQNRMPES
jgi:hypothetical protein